MFPFARQAFDFLEHPFVEDVCPGVDEVRDDLGRFLRDRNEVLPLDRDDAVAAGPLALCNDDPWLVAGRQKVLDEATVDHIAPVEDEERLLEVRPGLLHRMGGPELFRLRDVRDVSVERLAVLEVSLDSLAAIADDEYEVADTVLNERLDHVFEEGSVP